MTRAQLPSEQQLEEWIEANPHIVSPDLHSVARQVNLGGKKMDLLAVASPGTWVICELKKMHLEREVVGQAIDYLSRLDEMSLDELTKLVKTDFENKPPETQELINQALSREENGEDRYIEIVLVGTEVRDELRRMVDVLARRKLPVRICSLSAVASDTAEGFVLMRDLTEGDVAEEVPTAQGMTYEERMSLVRARFASVGWGEWLEGVLDVVAKNPNLYPRPWKRALMIAPEAHHGRYLAYLYPKAEGVYGSFGIDAVEEFFPSADLQSLETLQTDYVFQDGEQLRDWMDRISAAIGLEINPTLSKKETWNGLDWYVAYGIETGRREWSDSVNFGFVSAGGGNWYSRTLRKVPVGARVFARIPKIGYVGCGMVTGPAVPFESADFLRDKALAGSYTHSNGEPEWVLPVEWVKTVEKSDALNDAGLFSNENSACRLRDVKTLSMLYEFFDVN